MEAILFYGDQDEATRRQVRSVAAQYSHRIGPRKRKKPKQTGQDRKHTHYKKLATAVFDGTPGSSTSPRDFQPQAVVLDSKHKSHDGAQVELDVIRTDAPQQGQREQLLRREMSGPDAWASSSEVGSEPAHSPHTPRLGFARSAGAPQSPDSPQSAYRRLPAYTWTEYPRYAVSQTGTASPQNASATAANRIAYELPNPAACNGGFGVGLCHPGQQNPPRSQPVDILLRPQHFQDGSIHSDNSLSRTPQQISVDGHELLTEVPSPSQHALQPRLQILRCVTEEKVAPSGDLSRWREANEDPTEQLGLSKNPD